MRSDYIDQIKRFEGFVARANWDYAQHTNGYGTKAKHAGEVIDKVEAEQRFAAEIAKARAAVERFAPNLDDGSAAALTSLTFNAGTAWMKSGLGALIKTGDFETAKQVFKQYVHAGGQRLPGLVARRAIEAQWMTSQPQASTHDTGERTPSVGATAPDPARPTRARSDAPSLAGETLFMSFMPQPSVETATVPATSAPGAPIPVVSAPGSIAIERIATAIAHSWIRLEADRRERRGSIAT